VKQLSHSLKINDEFLQKIAFPMQQLYFINQQMIGKINLSRHNKKNLFLI